MRADDPRHGTSPGATAHWRDGEKPCEPCRIASNRRRKRNNLDAISGNPPRRPLGEAAWNIIHNTPRAALAARTGIAHDKLGRYDKGGPGITVHRTTQARILEAGDFWTPIGIQRRLQALSALGWTMPQVAAATGFHVDSLKRMRRRQDIKFVRREFADTIVATYERMSMRLPASSGPATETRNEARRQGWPPPLAWDDIDHDPTPRSTGYQAGRSRDDYDEVVVLRILAGERIPSTKAEKTEVMRRWLMAGGSQRQLCERMGWKDARYAPAAGGSNEDADSTDTDNEEAA